MTLQWLYLILPYEAGILRTNEQEEMANSFTNNRFDDFRTV